MLENEIYSLCLRRNPFGNGPFVAIELPYEMTQCPIRKFLFLMGGEGDTSVDVDINQLIDSGKNICRKTGATRFIAGNEHTAFLLDPEGNLL